MDAATLPMPDASPQARPMLEIEGLRKRFGGLTVFDDLAWRVGAGELHCILGPNGTGKTTLFNLITGRLRPDQGRICFEGQDITRLSIDRINRLGIGRKFQAPSIFPEMTARDNLLVAAAGHASLRQLFSARPSPATQRRCDDILGEIGLTTLQHTLAANLSHGQKQWLEIGIVMLNAPRLILLDEPTAGMTLAETAATADLIRRVFRGHTTIIIEHDIAFVRRLACPVTVLYRGKVMREGSFEQIAADPAVRRIYLGEED